MPGQLEEAIAAYRALLRINPGHFWGRRNLAGLLLRLGRTEELADLSVRRAKLEPNSFENNLDAAWSLAIIAENTEQARLYLERADQLLSAMSNRTEVADGAVWFKLFPAYQAWMKDDAALGDKELAHTEENPLAHNGVVDPLDSDCSRWRSARVRAPTTE